MDTSIGTLLGRSAMVEAISASVLPSASMKPPRFINASTCVHNPWLVSYYYYYLYCISLSNSHLLLEEFLCQRTPLCTPLLRDPHEQMLWSCCAVPTHHCQIIE